MTIATLAKDYACSLAHVAHLFKWMHTMEYELLQCAVVNGSLRFCRLAIEWGGSLITLFHINTMLASAARAGNDELCRYLKEEFGADDFHAMLRGAAEGGHTKLCYLSKEWSECAGMPPDCEQMLRGAAFGGHEEPCRLAKEWSERAGVHLNVEWMLLCSALGGHVHLCCLAKEWGAKNYHGMLEASHAHIRELARKWIAETETAEARAKLRWTVYFISVTLVVLWESFAPIFALRR